MTFYLQQEGRESGPFTWVEIYSLLRNDQISYEDLVREETSEEFQRIEELGLWNEGSDVGPLTWEEILFLRENADLRDEIFAKIEGEEQFSTLEELLQNRPSLFRGGFNILEWTKRAFQARPVLASLTALLVLVLVTLLFTFGRQQEASAPDSVAAGEDMEPAVPAQEELENEPSLASGPHGAVPETSNSVEPGLDLGEGAPASETQAGESGIAHSSPSTDPITQLPEFNEHILDLALRSNEVQPTAIPLAPGNPQRPLAQQIQPALDLYPTSPSVEAFTHENPVRTDAANSQILPPTPQTTPTAQRKPTATENLSYYFTIHSTRLQTKAGRDGIGVWEEEKDERGRPTTGDFRESVVVEVSTKHHTAAKDLFARAYFYDRSGILVEAQKSPAKAGKTGSRTLYAMPVLFEEKKRERLFFPVPTELKEQRWQVVVVFGDKEEAKVSTYPPGVSLATLEFPEKQLVMDRTIKMVERKKVANRVIEYVSKTRNPKHPQLTLFLRPPKGIDDWSEVKGVYALVVLANNVDDIRRRMQADELDGDEAGTFAFANKHKLAVLMWGSQRTWNPGMNWDDYERRQGQELDRAFDQLAEAWERGIQHFHKEYGIPTRNFFLQGNCGAAQWAKRLCLRKPDYFIAAHVHMPGSYDRPKPEAAKVLWCLTIGELEGGYERSIRWAQTARDMGYPLIYKPIPGLGHAGHPTANKLAHETFEFAMKHIADREAYDAQLKDRLRTSEPEHWLKEFVNPPYFADFINQEVFPTDQVEMIPEPFRMPLPTKGIADVWMMAR